MSYSSSKSQSGFVSLALAPELLTPGLAPAEASSVAAWSRDGGSTSIRVVEGAVLIAICAYFVTSGLSAFVG